MTEQQILRAKKDIGFEWADSSVFKIRSLDEYRTKMSELNIQCRNQWDILPADKKDSLRKMGYRMSITAKPWVLFNLSSRDFYDYIFSVPPKKTEEEHLIESLKHGILFPSQWTRHFDQNHLYNLRYVREPWDSFCYGMRNWTDRLYKRQELYHLNEGVL